jgi:hypothetical protein
MSDIDAVLIRAYTDLNSSRPCSTEDITCDPVYRNLFLSLVHQHLPNLPEGQALRRLSYLRKQSRLPCFRRNSSLSVRG